MNASYFCGKKVCMTLIYHISGCDEPLILYTLNCIPKICMRDYVLSTPIYLFHKPNCTTMYPSLNFPIKDNSFVRSCSVKKQQIYRELYTIFGWRSELEFSRKLMKMGMDSNQTHKGFVRPLLGIKPGSQ